MLLLFCIIGLSGFFFSHHSIIPARMPSVLLLCCLNVCTDLSSFRQSCQVALSDFSVILCRLLDWQSSFLFAPSFLPGCAHYFCVACALGCLASPSCSHFCQDILRACTLLFDWLIGFYLNSSPAPGRAKCVCIVDLIGCLVSSLLSESCQDDPQCLWLV